MITSRRLYEEHCIQYNAYLHKVLPETNIQQSKIVESEYGVVIRQDIYITSNIFVKYIQPWLINIFSFIKNDSTTIVPPTQFSLNHYTFCVKSIKLYAYCSNVRSVPIKIQNLRFIRNEIENVARVSRFDSNSISRILSWDVNSSNTNYIYSNSLHYPKQIQFASGLCFFGDYGVLCYSIFSTIEHLYVETGGADFWKSSSSINLPIDNLQKKRLLLLSTLQQLEGGSHYLVMEYSPHGNLSTFLQSFFVDSYSVRIYIYMYICISIILCITKFTESSTKIRETNT